MERGFWIELSAWPNQPTLRARLLTRRETASVRFSPSPTETKSRTFLFPGLCSFNTQCLGYDFINHRSSSAACLLWLPSRILYSCIAGLLEKPFRERSPLAFGWPQSVKKNELEQRKAEQKHFSKLIKSPSFISYCLKSLPLSVKLFHWIPEGIFF